jgi:hypothetical protein
MWVGHTNGNTRGFQNAMRAWAAALAPVGEIGTLLWLIIVGTTRPGG